MVWSRHEPLLLLPGRTPDKVLEDELEGHETSKGTIRFPEDAPLPATLVRKLVKARIAEQAATKRRRACMV